MPSTIDGHPAALVADSGNSAVAWQSIVGGALAAIAVTLILLALGAGLGFSVVSPWRGVGATATAFGVGTAIWLIVMQWLSSALGGYLAGRLRTRWVGIHPDESYFRDTAHGFLAWALATVLAVTIVSSAVTSLAGGAARGASAIGAAAVQGASQGAAQSADASSGPVAYLTDMLFRSDHPAANAQDARAESARILLRGLGPDGISDADKTYLARLVAANTGLSEAEAAKRVDEVIAQVKAQEARLREAADAARKAARNASFFVAFSMLIGAFIGGAAGALGGAHRDRVMPL
jgi:hypothetical protein